MAYPPLKVPFTSKSLIPLIYHDQVEQISKYTTILIRTLLIITLLKPFIEKVVRAKHASLLGENVIDFAESLAHVCPRPNYKH